MQAAGKRYQSTTNGKHKHAERQSRYRQRIQNKVTHQGSTELPANDLLLDELTKEEPEVKSENIEVLCCHFCGKQCSPYLRLRFINSDMHRPIVAWPCAP